MKNLILAAIAILSVGMAVANAQPLRHRAPPSHSAGYYNWTAGGGG
jgi:hypothetical protein